MISLFLILFITLFSILRGFCLGFSWGFSTFYKSPHSETGNRNQRNTLLYVKSQKPNRALMSEFAQSIISSNLCNLNQPIFLLNHPTLQQVPPPPPLLGCAPTTQHTWKSMSCSWACGSGKTPQICSC